MRLRMFIRTAVAVILLASALAAAPPASHSAPRPGPQGPGQLPGPRNGDPDMPEWNNRAYGSVHGQDGASSATARVTLWSYLRALFARDEA